MEGERSLLVQALDNRHPLSDDDGVILASSTRSGSSLSPNETSDSAVGELHSFLPMHSDFTIHTSNISVDALAGEDAPEQLSDPPPQRRRSVLGGNVDKKYNRYRLPTEHRLHRPIPLEDRGRNVSEVSELTNPTFTPPPSPLARDKPMVSPLPLTPFSPESDNDSTPTKRSLRAHETIHAQSLLLGLAFLVIWSPQNMMAPNLTEMADDFHFETAAERDTFLGANLALATGVLSLPIAGGIGILADMWNRKHLFVLTVAAGGIFAACTGASRSYHWLFLSRLLNGGAMSGSVPVAFSLLGDLFDTHERNAASSGLTAMMGVGIIGGQVYAGWVGSSLGWSHAFYVSAAATLLIAALVLLLVQEPMRGGKEKALQDMLQQGTRYERTLTWEGFLHTMRHNTSNAILLWQGFFSSVPWGIMFVFLNDYLSQERGFTVPDATFLVLVFGIGAAVGGISGGYVGGLFHARNPSYLPIFMAVTTFLGIFPFLFLLNGRFTNAHGYKAIFWSFLAGTIGSLPSVSVRPCIINVNPPETRGAALTAANLIIQLARGVGPSCITVMGAIWAVNRRFSLNVTLIFFWIISAIQLLFLAKYLPQDQDAMEAELVKYATSAMEVAESKLAEEESIVSIEDRMTAFDAGAARESLKFMGDAIREIEHEIRTKRPFRQLSCKSSEDDMDDDHDPADIEHRRNVWINQQQALLHQQGDSDQASPEDLLLPNGTQARPADPDNHQTPNEKTRLL